VSTIFGVPHPRETMKKFDGKAARNIFENETGPHFQI
jgi:hypothetical protein